MGTKIGHYFDKQEGKYLPLIPQASSTSCGRVFITDDTNEESTAKEKAVVLSPFAINHKITTLQENIITTYQAADTALEKKITDAYQKADTDLATAYKDADTALEKKITDAYQKADADIIAAYQKADTDIIAAYKDADTALEKKITDAYQKADTDLATAYQAADSTLEKKITDGTVTAAAANKLNIDSNYTGAKILNFTNGTPAWYSGEEIGSLTKPIYVNEKGEFSICNGTMHSTTDASILENDETSLVLGGTSVSLISNVTLAQEGKGENAVTTGHIQEVTRTNLSLNKADDNSLGGVQSSDDLTFAEGKGTVANLNLSSVKVNKSETTSLQNMFDDTLKKSGDTFTGNLIGEDSNIIFTGDNNGLLWRLDGVDYDLLKTDTIELKNSDGTSSQGHIYALGSTAFDTHIKGTSLYLQPSSGYLHINEALGNNILQNEDGITLGNDQSILHLLSNGKGIHTNYPVQMHSARFVMHTPTTSVTGVDFGAAGKCIPLDFVRGTSVLSDLNNLENSDKKLFTLKRSWNSNEDTAEHRGVQVNYAGYYLISAKAYAQNLTQGANATLVLQKWDSGDKKTYTLGSRIETRQPSAANTAFLQLPPALYYLDKGDRVGIRIGTYGNTGIVPIPTSDIEAARNYLEITCYNIG